MPFLVTPPLPNCRVEIAFDSGFATPEGDRTWTDVTDLVEGALGATITYGRADELSTPDPNTLNIAFDNRLGHFTPGKSTLADGSPHPYFPNVKKGKPIRFTSIYGGVDYIRFTGYINEYPLVWPDGSSAASTVTVTATSRRARLGQTAPLTSAIRAAYLATGPEAYWPMDEDADITDQAGRQAFRDITNDPTRLHETEFLGAFSNTTALAPVVRDGSAGPTDEQSLVRVPKSTSFSDLFAYAHYVGAGTAIRLNSTGNVTIECVARISADIDVQNITTVMGIFSADGYQKFEFLVASDGDGDPTHSGMGPVLTYLTDAYVLVPTTLGSLYDADAYAQAIDGELHHYALVLSGGDTVTAYFDGASIFTDTLTGGFTYNKRLTNITFASDTYQSTVWVGHGAVHDSALSGAQILAHAQAATAASETPEERVVRVAGRIGVPADEIDVEATIAAEVGPQPEAGQSAASVLDDLATSTGGVLYDTREGHLAMQARNHRYNLASAFTLNATTQEIEGDLTVTDDHRYTINTVVYSRSGSDDVAATIDDQDSIDDYGVFSQTYTVVSEQDTEVEAFAQNILARYADPAPRVSTVSVDVTNTEATQRDLVLTADIGTRFGIQSLPGQAPADPMYLFLEGYTETITATSHMLSMNTTPADIYQNVFVWDDPVRGLWDSGNVWAY